MLGIRATNTLELVHPGLEPRKRLSVGFNGTAALQQDDVVLNVDVACHSVGVKDIPSHNGKQSGHFDHASSSDAVEGHWVEPNQEAAIDTWAVDMYLDSAQGAT